jgi:hypothetical protein
MSFSNDDFDSKMPDDDFDMPGDYPDEYEDDGVDEELLQQQQEKEALDVPIGEHGDLDHLERRLRDEVDDDFFDDPRKFHTLHRVIDVLGAQMDDAPTTSNNLFDSGRGQSSAIMVSPAGLRNSNPAYRALKKQQRVVEDAIEHMAVKHCADLNSSVVQVGKVARQFSDAVHMVRHLRRQVRDIKETLGSSNPVGSGNNETSAAQAAAMSLRELWLKKLECEAVLLLLEKMDIIRAAPSQFDRLIDPPGPCRIGAAVVCLSKALQICFSADVASVSALQNIGKQITDRKQRADQIIWDTLFDVVYLRTGNGVLVAASAAAAEDAKNKKPADTITIQTSSASVVSESRKNGMKNPFITKHRLTLAHTDKDDDDDDDSMASWFSHESEDREKTGAQYANVAKMVIPGTILEAELDLEADEQRCLEEIMLAGDMGNEISMWDEEDHHGRNLPRYTDHVMPLRILVECLAKLERLDDVERTLSENIQQEIRKLAQKEQARTFTRLEKVNPSRRRAADLSDFRRHLTGLLSSFGCVMIRLSHLAQILRHRIVSILYGWNGSILRALVTVSLTLFHIFFFQAPMENLYSYKNKSAAMRSVLSSAYDAMQKELKDFLIACIREDDEEEDGHHRRGGHNRRSRDADANSDTRGLFSLGITDSLYKKDSLSLQPESRANQMQQNASKFVSNVLMPKTSTSPDARHALEFRRSIAVWTTENDALQKELSDATGEDTTSAAYRMHDEERAIHFLDDIIKKQLIPVLQHEAISGTTKALEHEDAFIPVIDRTLYGRPNSNEPQDVDMCIACQALYNSTGPLFMALHRLPKDEKMYLHLVGVLEHTILTFISRVKPRVGQLCNDKMALRLLLETSKEGKDKSFGIIIEKRKAFAQLINAYADGELLEAGQVAEEDPNVNPLTPSAADVKARGGDKGKNHGLDVLGGVEKEEGILTQELLHLKSILDITNSSSSNIVCCSDEELLNACSLSHSLLKLSSLLEARLKVRVHSSGTYEKALTSTRALREAIKTIKAHGLKVAKFCRIDMLMQKYVHLYFLDLFVYCSASISPFLLIAAFLVCKRFAEVPQSLPKMLSVFPHVSTTWASI